MRTDSDRKSTSAFSAPLMAVLTSVSLFAFVAVFALLGWAPDLADRNRAGHHPYSESALGYAALVSLLEADGQEISVSRLASSRDTGNRLLILSLPEYGLKRVDDFIPSRVTGPALYILPKWSGLPDAKKKSWQRHTSLLKQDRIATILTDFDPDLGILRIDVPDAVTTPFGRFSLEPDEGLQTLESTVLEPVIQVGPHQLLSKLPGEDIFLLTDPDLANTFGLIRADHAAFSLSLIDWLKEYPAQPLIFDATLHGFERSENLLRSIFDAPFLGATLIALSSVVLIGWAAFVRLTPPKREQTSILFGKRALAESTAGLISMSRREAGMAEPYLDSTRRFLILRLGLPRQITDHELALTLDRIAAQKHLDTNWSEVQRMMLDRPRNRTELRDRAHKVWRWRKEMTDGH